MDIRTYMKLLAVISVGSLLLLPAPLQSETPDNNDIPDTDPPAKGTRTAPGTSWSMYKGNAGHTGLSPYSTAGNDGTLRWRFLLGDHHSVGHSILLSLDGDDTAYIYTLNNELYAVNKDRSLKWKAEVPERYWKSAYEILPSIVPDDSGNVYFGTSEGNFYCFGSDGGLKWQYEAGGSIYSPPVMDAAGALYFGCDDEYLYALTSGGELKWKYHTMVPVLCSPAIDDSGVIYIYTKMSVDDISSPQLTAIYPNGTTKWIAETHVYSESSPVISPAGTIYLSGRNSLYSCDNGGNLIWNISTNITYDPVIGPDGTIYQGAHAFNPDGSEKWKHSEWIFINAVSADGTVYATAAEGNFYALYPNGTTKWYYRVEKYCLSIPAIGSDGTVYVCMRDSHMGLYSFGSEMALKPSEPFELKASGYGLDVSLRWNIPYDDGSVPISEYRIYRGTGSGDVEYHDSIMAVNESLYTFGYGDESVKNGKTYFYRVSAVNSEGESGLSEEVNATYYGIRGEPDEDEFKQKTETFFQISGVLAVVFVIVYIGVSYAWTKEERRRRGGRKGRDTPDKETEEIETY